MRKLCKQFVVLPFTCLLLSMLGHAPLLGCFVKLSEGPPDSATFGPNYRREDKRAPVMHEAHAVMSAQPGMQ